MLEQGYNEKNENNANVVELSLYRGVVRAEETTIKNAEKRGYIKNHEWRKHRDSNPWAWRYVSLHIQSPIMMN